MRKSTLVACLALAACARESTPGADSASSPATAGGSQPAPPATPSTPTADSVAVPWAINEQGAGPVRVGMTTADARAASLDALALPVTLDASCTHVRVRAGAGGLRFMVTADTIVRVEMDSAAVPTTRGARVGDTEDRIRALYGAGVRTMPHKYVQGGHYLVATPLEGDTTRQLVFETDGRVVTRYRAGRTPEVGWVEGCS